MFNLKNKAKIDEIIAVQQKYHETNITSDFYKLEK